MSRSSPYIAAPMVRSWDIMKGDRVPSWPLSLPRTAQQITFIDCNGEWRPMFFTIYDTLLTKDIAERLEPFNLAVCDSGALYSLLTKVPYFLGVKWIGIGVWGRVGWGWRTPSYVSIALVKILKFTCLVPPPCYTFSFMYKTALL